MDDKFIDIIFKELWSGLKIYSKKDDDHCVELNLKLENKEGVKIEASTTNITLSKSELLDYIKESAESVVLDNKIFLNKDKGLIEVPIYIEPNFRLMVRHVKDSEYIHDSKNKLNYKISPISVGASIRLLLKEKDKHGIQLILRRFRPFPYREHYKISNQSSMSNENKLRREALSTIISPRGNFFVVKIKDDNLKDAKFYKEYVNSLVFNMNLVNYKGCNFRIVDNLSDYVNGQSRVFHHYSRKIVKTPKLCYPKHLTDLYSAGSWTDNPFTAFINYYQIIEYFFNEIPDNRLFKIVQSEITSPLFSYDKKEDVMRLTKKIYKIRCSDMNELNSLEIVLDHFLDIDMLKSLLDENSENTYKNDVPIFVSNNKKEICFNINSFDENRDENIKCLARRIYSIRNALVHNKDNNQNNYNPQHHYKSLTKEVPLIRAIASSIIIKSGEPFQSEL